MRRLQMSILFPAMRVLISGAGIAGPTLAYWLAHYGLEATIVERAPKLRTGGYIIDFWGLGFDIADRMGLLPEIHRKGYMVQDVRIVDRSGKRVVGIPSRGGRSDSSGPLHQPCTGRPLCIDLWSAQRQSRNDFQRQHRSHRANRRRGSRPFRNGNRPRFRPGRRGRWASFTSARARFWPAKIGSRSIWGTKSLRSKWRLQAKRRTGLCHV